MRWQKKMQRWFSSQWAQPFVHNAVPVWTCLQTLTASVLLKTLTNNQTMQLPWQSCFNMLLSYWCELVSVCMLFYSKPLFILRNKGGFCHSKSHILNNRGIKPGKIRHLLLILTNSAHPGPPSSNLDGNWCRLLCWHHFMRITQDLWKVCTRANHSIHSLHVNNSIVIYTLTFRSALT